MGPLSKLIIIQHISLNSINNHDSYFAEQMLAVIVYKSNHILSLRILSKHFHHTTALCILFKKSSNIPLPKLLLNDSRKLIGAT